jgi:hypothetical protein
MPVKGFPDAKRHKLCSRCQKWHEPDEGTMFFRRQPGLFGGVRTTAARLAGDDSAKRFICHRCQRIRLLIGLLVFVLFFFVAAAILTYQQWLPLLR